MQLTKVLLFAGTALASPAAQALPALCPLSNCLFRDTLPGLLKPAASAFCTGYLGSKRCTKTKTVSKTSTTTKTVTPAVGHTTVTATTTSTIGSACATTTTTTTTTTDSNAFPTNIEYAHYTSSSGQPTKRGESLDERGVVIPSWFTANCKTHPATAVSGACECFIGPTTVTSTHTAVHTVTVTAAAPPVVTATVTSVITTSTCTSTSTSTSTSTVTEVGAFTCGLTFTAAPTAAASGSVTCANNLPLPSANAYFRIEGNDAEGTIFEGCIQSGPRVVTTPSGGSHECDGTNAGANPAPGTTPTDQIQSAAELLGFGFDGTWDDEFDDFFITSIANSPQTSNQFWGILQNGQFTPSGGCQTETTNADSDLWAWNAFNVNFFLQVTPEYAVVEAGSGSIALQVTDSQSGQPIAGASIGGQVTDANGEVLLPIPDAGCWQYKATRNDSIRSNAFYLTVVDQFANGESNDGGVDSRRPQSGGGN